MSRLAEKAQARRERIAGKINSRPKTIVGLAEDRVSDTAWLRVGGLRVKTTVRPVRDERGITIDRPKTRS